MRISVRMYQLTKEIEKGMEWYTLPKEGKR